MLLSVDTETTGYDLRHGAKPFFVTTCTGEGEQRWWEWPVNPYMREPQAPEDDLAEIAELIDAADTLVLQNAKFDVTALASVFPAFNWPWGKTVDTLLAAHLLASNRPHDLTALAVQYLGINITPAETALEEAVKKCRSRVQQARLKVKRSGEANSLAAWRIAEPGLEEMPSSKGENWRADYWLPAALAKVFPQEYPAGHPYRTVLRDYGNVDSEVTAMLWPVMEREIERRQLGAIYRERLKLLPIAYRMESDGVTLSKPRLEELRDRYQADSAEAERKCVSIAASYTVENPKSLFGGSTPYVLTLPKGGRNNSLNDFVFNVLKLPVLKRTDSGAPSMDKTVMDEWAATLDGPGLDFITTLKGKRSRDTAITYLGGYERFWRQLLSMEEDYFGTWFRLHPNLNPTGTDTLRWSSSNPNEQNISKKEDFNLRYVFGPGPGREWWSLDAKNIELRLPAYLAEETALIELFERPDDPPYYGSNHLLNFHTVYPEIWERELGKTCTDPKCCNGKIINETRIGGHCKKQFASTYYQYCKNGWFAKQYGAGPAKVDGTFRRKGANSLLDRGLPNLARLNAETIRFADKHGYVETIPDRTVDPKRGYPLLCTRTDQGGILPTVPLNYKIQGSAMWWTARAMVRCQEQLDEWRANGFDGRIALQVHDEIVFDLPKRADPVKDPKASNLKRVRRLAELMAKGGDDFGIPTPCGIEYHADNWSEGVTI